MIRTSILQPQAFIPAGDEGTRMNGERDALLSEQDIDSLICYIVILKKIIKKFRPERRSIWFGYFGKDLEGNVVGSWFHIWTRYSK